MKKKKVYKFKIKNPYIIAIFILAALFIYSAGINYFDKNVQQNSERNYVSKSPNVELFFVDPLKYKSAQNICENEPCLALAELLDKAEESIDFAVYGFEKEERIQKALLDAQQRGVKIRGVVDKTADNTSYYKDTDSLAQKIKNVKNDYEPPSKHHKKRKEGIMHDKYFIVDNRYIWTGSMNMSPNCITYNANVSVLIDSPKLAKVYKKDFEQMYSGKFHKEKSPVNAKKIITNDSTEITPFFLPEDRQTDKEIVNLISNATEYIYIPVFYFTYNNYANALISAKKRGVDIKVIVDATSAKNASSVHKKLSKAGIEVKVENWGGKMHMKSMIIDDTYILVGSMNFTKSGYSLNDENTLLIKNSQLAQDFRDFFIYLWNSIPD